MCPLKSTLPVSTAKMMEFQWEQRGGRIKLVEIDGVVSVGKDGMRLKYSVMFLG